MKYSNLSSEVQNHCKQCGKEIFRKRDNIFCNKSCAAKFNNKVEYLEKLCLGCGRSFSVPPYLGHRQFCSNKCGVQHLNRSRALIQNKKPKMIKQAKHKKQAVMTEISCGFCSKNFLKWARDIKKPTKTGKNFCSRSCRTKYVHANCNPTQNVKQSVPQQMLFNLLKEKYPTATILYNDRTVLKSSLELDIVLPDIKLAIEVNGPTHYFPIYGEEKFDAVINRDSIKLSEAQAIGYEVLILNVSAWQKRDYPAHIQNTLNEIIIPIIEKNGGPSRNRT